MEKSDIGLIGLAVMGENLALNMESRGFRVSVYNRTVPGVEEEVAKRFVSGRGAGKAFAGFDRIDQFLASLKSPRKVFMMVRAGKPVDELIEQMLPHLEPGDILMDGGNSQYTDTERRVAFLESKGLLFIGTGVSGGEEGALKGPSIMPGGSEKAWPAVKPILQAIAAKADDGSPCCEWMGSGGAGHFVKTIHNGIEYSDMQLISEAYSLMKGLFRMPNELIAESFSRWNKGKLQSYLIEISAEIMQYKEPDESWLIDKILDSAGQKGTGKWSVTAALDLGVPLGLIATAVFERNLSANKEERLSASKLYQRELPGGAPLEQESVQQIESALFASKLVAYAQGFSILRQASEEWGWKLNLAAIARIWRSGCIIRSAFLNRIAEAYQAEPALSNLLKSPWFVGEMQTSLPRWKQLVALATTHEIGIPAFSSALQYLYSLTSEHLPANLIQAQRDYFGAHTYERTDAPRGQFFHTNWTGKGGDTRSGSYNV
ncbi:MAG: decarboxylating NADP(+)-dependent phosphogluconate dehydrogenase [Bacteroidales bacterium]